MTTKSERAETPVEVYALPRTCECGRSTLEIRYRSGETRRWDPGADSLSRRRHRCSYWPTKHDAAKGMKL